MGNIIVTELPLMGNPKLMAITLVSGNLGLLPNVIDLLQVATKAGLLNEATDFIILKLERLGVNGTINISRVKFAQILTDTLGYLQEIDISRN